MTETIENAFAVRWLAAVRFTPGLTGRDKAVAKWMASNLNGGTIVHRTWQQMRNEMKLPNYAAGIHLTALTKMGFVGERIRTGPDAGFPLELPLPKSKTQRTNERIAADRRAADLRADAKWLAK
ncbi:hypothetical protein [Arthrobacter sp. Y81]|uniref:hypothetical protein n=1 Tax=Arthrobacter sp. Y81 TaxID=2058897 RepID=UPI000CE4444F|nr:hypothetical protein [Arthrobacter sp. Y81]